MNDRRSHKRVLIYSHDSFGLGHLRRCRAIAHAIDADPEDVYHVLQHLAANDSSIQGSGEGPGEEKFSRIK